MIDLATLQRLPGYPALARNWNAALGWTSGWRPAQTWRAAARAADRQIDRVLPAQVGDPLRRIAARASSVAAREGLCAALVLLGLLLGLECWFDWLADLAQPVRVLLFLGQIALVLAVLWFGVVEPWRARMPLRLTALRLQEVQPQLRSSVVCALELLGGWGHSSRGSPGMAERLARQVAGALSKVDSRRVISCARLRRLSIWAGAVVAINALWIALLWPGSGVMLARWAGSSAPLPTRTIVRDVVAPEAVARGTEVVLTARAEGVIPDAGEVRLVFDEGERQSVPARLAENGTGVFEARIPNVQSTFDFIFILNDGRSAATTVKVVQSPAITEFTIRETFPAYTGREPVTHRTGSFTFLQGSTLEAAVQADQPLREAVLLRAGLERPLPLAVAEAGARSASGAFQVQDAQLTGLSVRLVNTDGVASSSETVFVARVVPDAPPQLEIRSPEATEETITPDGKLPIAYEVSDDFGVGSVSLVYSILPAAGSPAAAPAEEKTIDLPLPKNAGALGEYVWDLQSAGLLLPGAAIRWALLARDRNDATGPGEARTDPRTLRVVTPDQKRAETLGRLREASDDIRTLGDRQRELTRALRESTPDK